MRRLLAWGLFLLACGCSGGTNGAVAPTPATEQINGGAAIRLTLTVPSKPASAARQTRTISPSTQSVGIVVNGGSQQTFNAAPGNAGCSAGTMGTTCTFTLAAPAGSDTFIVTTYSGSDGTGAALDQMSMTQTILNGANSVSIVLGPVISSTRDSGPGSLRQAVADANAGDTITFIVSMPATVTLTTGVTLAKSVTLAGPSASNLTISGNHASQIFVVNSGATVTISGMTLTNGNSGNAAGGAIDNKGTLAVTGVALSSNTTSANGGAIYNENGASLTVTDSVFTGNSTGSGNNGGAIYSEPSAQLLSVLGSTFAKNSATTGGAIDSEGPATLSNDRFVDNAASGAFAYGGAIEADSTLTVSGCTFSGNVAAGGPGGFGYGGAIFADQNVTISSSTFLGNSAGGTGSGYGGAIFLLGSLIQTGVTFSDNTPLPDVFAGSVDRQAGNRTRVRIAGKSQALPTLH